VSCIKLTSELDNLALTLRNGISVLDKADLDLAVDVTLRIRYVVNSLLELATEASNLVLLRSDVVGNSFGHALSLNNVAHGLLKLSIDS